MIKRNEYVGDWIQDVQWQWMENRDCYLCSTWAGFIVLPGAAPTLSGGRMAEELMVPQSHLAAIIWHKEWLAGLGWLNPASHCGGCRESTKHGTWSQPARVLMPALPQNSCVALDKLVNLTTPQFLLLENADNGNGADFTEFFHED